VEIILNSGVQFITWLQKLGSWLTPVMKLFTDIGSEQFYLVIAPAILWCIDTTFGLRMIIFLLFNGMFNTALKVAFHGPRPYWYTRDVRALGSAENSFGVPSGHAQNSVVVWGALAEQIKHRWAWIIATLLMLLIGVSRIYLALHFPHDVLQGWVFGIIMLWLFVHLEKPILNWYKKMKTTIQLILAFLTSLALILIVLIAQLTLRGWSLPIDWVNNAHLAFPAEPVINPLSYHNFLFSTGAFFGLAAGWIWILKLGGFSTMDAWWKLVLRYLVGILGLGILYLAPNAILTESETVISYIAQYIRYALIGFWISGLAPWIFLKLKLASKTSRSS